MQTALYILAGLALLACGFAGGMYFGFQGGVRSALDLLKRSLEELKKDVMNG